MNVLISGGTGLIGTRLSELLIQKGHIVGILTRNIPEVSSQNIKYFKWNPAKNEIDEEALYFANVVINLAGASIIGKRWNPEYKKELVNSRTQSTSTLVSKINTNKYKINLLVNASAIGIYGFDNPNKLSESSDYASNFLAQICIKWEEEANKLNVETCRLFIPRIGIVLSTKDGALKEIMSPMKKGFGASLGSGKQMTSWIHIDDLCSMIIWPIENPEIKGVYLGTSPSPVTNEELTKKAAKVMGKPLWLPNVPEFMLKIILGEAYGAVVGGINAPAKKAMLDGFQFQFTNLETAISDLVKFNK